LTTAAAVRKVAGGFNPALIEDEIPTAAAIHSYLPAEIMRFIKSIHKILPKKKELRGIQQFVELAFNLMRKAQPWDLEIAGIRSCTVPGVHGVISKMGLEKVSHFLAGSQIYRSGKPFHDSVPP
jgi:hypothetical protein